MKLKSHAHFNRALLAAALIGAASLAAAPARAQDEEACAPPTVVDTPPPPLPDYDQPPVPGPNYLWSPGYWSWDADEGDYYWVPGTWALPPRSGLLWTPGYWGWVAGAFLFHPGYWGERVGFYGGVDYGYGYSGHGYAGGRWDHGVFFYNRSVNNLGGASIRNVYEEKVTEKRMTNISYNGGKGGVDAKPTTEDKAFAKEKHFAPTTQQRQHVDAASKDTSLFEKSNHGAPAIGATARPGELKGPGVAPSHGATGTQPVAPAKSETIEPGKPTSEEKKFEEKKPTIEENKSGAAKPAIEEKKAPAGIENKPAIEQKRPVIEEKRPAIEEKRPAIEEKRPAIEEKRPEPAMKPEPKTQMQRVAPPPQSPRPQGKQEEKKKEP